MKRFLTIALLGFFMVQIPAVGGNVRNSNSGRQEAEVRPVSNFTGILSSGHYEVVVSLGATETLKVEGSSEALKLVETVVENGILKNPPQKPVRQTNRRSRQNKSNNHSKVAGRSGFERVGKYNSRRHN